jgi:hypothetical protein
MRKVGVQRFMSDPVASFGPTMVGARRDLTGNF